MSARDPLSFDLALLNGVVLAAGRLYYVVLRVFFIYFFVEAIGVTQYGFYNYAQSWYVLLVPVAIWGGNELLISGFLPRSDAERAEFAGTALSLRLLLGLVCMLLILGVGLFAEDRDKLSVLILLFAPAVFLRGLISLFSSLFIARGRSVEWVRVSVSFMTIEVILILWLALSGGTLFHLGLLQIGIWCATLLTASVYYGRRYGWLIPRWRGELAAWYLRAGMSVGAASFLLLFLSPGLLIAYRALAPDLSELGNTALVLQVFLILQQLLSKVSSALLPALQRASGDRGGNLVEFSAIALKLSLSVGGTLCLLSLTILPALLAWLPRTEFHAALYLFGASAWITVPLLAVQSLRLVLIAGEDADGYLLAAVSGVAIALGAVVHASSYPMFGTLDVLRAMGAGLSAVALVQLYRVWKIAALARPRLGEATVFVAVLALLAAVSSAAVPLPVWMVMALAALFGGLALRQLRQLRSL